MPIHQCNASTRMNETGKRVKSIVDDNVKRNGNSFALVSSYR